MRDFLKTRGRHWVRTGWFWPLALLMLPNCFLDSTGYGVPPETFDPGPAPISSAVMCDIPKMFTTQCADVDEAEGGISFAAAAVALAQGEQSNLGLDYSSSAACPGGLPMRTEFHGPFPDGLPVCLNCMTQIPAVYAGPTDVCVAKCKDLLNNTADATTAEIATFCEANARPSINFDKDVCYDNVCTSGTLDPAFVDPRRTAEAVNWIDQEGTSAVGNSLTREAETTGQNSENFDAGAGSSELITLGDGWVEFEAVETDLSHVLGLMSLSCFPNCGDPGLLDDLPFAISLNKDGNQYLIEGGTLLMGPGINGSFGPFAEGERYRVRFTDKHNGSAEISYTRLVGPCNPGTACNETVIAISGSTLQYPFRVGATFRELGATLANVTIVRIIE